MKSLVTCDQVGGSLELWLKTASPEQLQDFYTQLLKHIKNCDGNSLVPSDKLATCKNVEEALKEYGKNLNQGTNLPADASDCSRSVTICGLNNMLNAAEDNAAKQAVANAIKNKALSDKAFRIALGKALLSKEAGNRIEARSDGIGVWDTATPDLAVQYVDAIDGNDDNPGTEAAPLRTVKRAIERINAGTGYGNYIITLKAGQTHVLQRTRIELPNVSIVFSGYGDTKYKYRSEEQPYPGYYIWAADDFKRPTLAVKKYTYTDAGGTERTLFAYLNVATLEMRGVNLHIEDGAPTNPGSGKFWMWGPVAVYISGGDIYVGAGNRIGRIKSIAMTHSSLSMGEGAKLVDVQYGCTVDATSDWTGGDIKTAPNLPAYTTRSNSIRGYLTPENLGAEFDRPTKRLFGASTTWDIFANS